MIVLKATQEQFDIINGVENKGAYVEFLKDLNDNWVTSVNCKTDQTYTKAVHYELAKLEEIEYEPKPYDENLI